MRDFLPSSSPIADWQLCKGCMAYQGVRVFLTVILSWLGHRKNWHHRNLWLCGGRTTASQTHTRLKSLAWHCACLSINTIYVCVVLFSSCNNLWGYLIMLAETKLFVKPMALCLNKTQIWTDTYIPAIPSFLPWVPHAMRFSTYIKDASFCQGEGCSACWIFCLRRDLLSLSFPAVCPCWWMIFPQRP